MLRNHPIMSYRGLNNWPPIWTWRGGAGDDKQPRGEIGILRDVFLSQVEPRSRLYLIMEHESDEYMGCLLFSDATLCVQICKLLEQHRGCPIADIGSLDVSYLV